MDDAAAIPAIAELVEQHAPLLYRYAYRLCGHAADAEDFTQQTFLVAQERQSQLRSAEHARGWLCTILRNLYLKSCRHRPPQSLDPHSLEGEPESRPAAAPPPGDIDQQQLQAALQELPEAFRTPLILFYFEEFSYQEIAEQLSVPLGTVMSRLARGKAHLKQRLTAAESLPATRAQRLSSAGIG